MKGFGLSNSKSVFKILKILKMREINGWSSIVEEVIAHDALSMLQLETCIFEGFNLIVLKVGSNLDGLDEWNRWSLLLVREHDDPLATGFFDTPLDVIGIKEQLHGLFVI